VRMLIYVYIFIGWHTLKNLVPETCTSVLFGASFWYQFLVPETWPCVTPVNSELLFRTDSRASGRILISCLTNNVTKDHIAEIFGAYGKINCIEIVTAEKFSGRAVCQQMIVEYETASEAHKAIKYMNGGMCDCVSSMTVITLIHTHRLNGHFFQANLA